MEDGRGERDGSWWREERRVRVEGAAVVMRGPL